jgi:hypothetical protein
LGEALNVVKKLNRERDHIAGNSASEGELREQLADEIADVAIYLDIMAASEGIDLGAAIASKFNRTSERVGFPERLPEHGGGGRETSPGVASHAAELMHLTPQEVMGSDPMTAENLAAKIRTVAASALAQVTP